MGKNAKRKQRPQPPRWHWLDTDGCWWCTNRKNCNDCKTLKQYKRRRDKEKYNGNERY